jgi:hypothetical protein
LVRRATHAGAATGEVLAVTCAPTGIAATLLPDGRTLHNTFALKVLASGVEGDQLWPDQTPSASAAKLRLERARLVVIDEISMVGEKILASIELRLRRWKDLMQVRNANALARSFMISLQSFGGVGMIFMGDFFQLPPQVGHSLPICSLDEKSRIGALFNNFNICQFTEQMRAVSDPQWMEALSFFTNPAR